MSRLTPAELESIARDAEAASRDELLGLWSDLAVERPDLPTSCADYGCAVLLKLECHLAGPPGSPCPIDTTPP